MDVRLGSYLNHIVGVKLSSWTFGVSTIYQVGGDHKGKIELPLILTFGGFVLRIYNSHEVYGFSDLDDLVGGKLENKVEKKEYVDLFWSRNRSLRILLDDDSYNGPEVMTLNGPNNLYVVWN